MPKTISELEDIFTISGFKDVDFSKFVKAQIDYQTYCSIEGLPHGKLIQKVINPKITLNNIDVKCQLRFKGNTILFRRLNNAVKNHYGSRKFSRLRTKLSLFKAFSEKMLKTANYHINEAIE